MYNKSCEDEVLKELHQSLELDKHHLKDNEEEEEEAVQNKNSYNNRHGLGYIPKEERVLTVDEIKLRDAIKGKKNKKMKIVKEIIENDDDTDDEISKLDLILNHIKNNKRKINDHTT